MFKNRIDIFDKGGLHIDEKIVGLSISQWLPCPFAIWNLLFGMAILLNLVCGSFSCSSSSEECLLPTKLMLSI